MPGQPGIEKLMTDGKILADLAFVRRFGNEAAKSYAGAAILYWMVWEDQERKSQLQYVLSNFASCRVDGAKEVKQRLREYESSLSY
jgi:hypothetical protein